MTHTIKLGHSGIFTGFEPTGVGTRITDPAHVLAAIESRLSTGDHLVSAPGQFEIPLSATGLLGGIGRRTQNQDDYVVRTWRGRVDMFLKREFAVPVAHAKAIVYTIDAYEADPQVSALESQVLRDQSVTHVIVAILAFAGPPAKLSPLRFVMNLAHGNNEALLWSRDEIVERAKAVERYDAEWCVVAD